MPVNKNLKAIKLPMQKRFGEKPTTEFKNNLDSIKVKLIGAPDMFQLRSYLPMFLEATWAENPYDANKLSFKEKDRIIKECLQGKALPTALETIRLTFCIEGISLQEVTHILRYRTASFSADCSGDKWWTHKAALVPFAVENSRGHYIDNGSDAYDEKLNFNKRYQEIVKAAKELYCDMIDSKKVSIMDARYILPRCLETFYFMSISLKDAIHFIKQRIDKQIQPETDNIIAYSMYLELLKRFPIMNGLIDIHTPSNFYVNMARTGKATNLYVPDADSDKFDYNKKDFIYDCERSAMNGVSNYTCINKFTQKFEWFEKEILKQERENKAILEQDYAFESTLDNN